MINNASIGSTYKRYSIILLIIVCILSVISKLSNVFKWIDSSLWKYYITGSMWLGLIICVKFILPQIHPCVKNYKLDRIYFDAIKYAIIILAANYMAGLLIYDIGKTPYDISPKGMLINFITQLIPFISMEMIRGYVLGSFCREKKVTLFFIVTLLMTLIDINYARLVFVNDIQTATMYIAEEIGPSFCKNLLLSYLALYGGAMASICYGGLLLIFHWYMPVLPDLNWLCEGVIGIFIPVFELFLLINSYENTYQSMHKVKMYKKDTVSWMGTMVISIAMIWFTVGVFPIYPTVIVTGSMKPLIDPGDIVLVKQFYKEEELHALKEGDIIVFKRDDIIITHRIAKILYDKDGNIKFKTKGDNNSAEDARIVLPNEVKGKYILDIPKLGYPTLLLKARNKRGDVEF